MTAKQKLQRVKLQQDRKTLAYERKYAKVVRVALREQVEAAINNRGVVDDPILFNALKGLYESILFDYLQFQYRLLDSRLTVKSVSFFLNPWRTWIQSYVFTSLAQRVTMINDTTRKKIQDIIAIGVDKGLEWDKIAELLRQKTDDIGSVYRSLMIARTETANAANMAKEKSSEDFQSETGEVIYKLWIHRFAKEPRTWHESLDNDVAIPKSQDFMVSVPSSGGIEYMSRPHSSGASAENTVQCSCQVIYVSERFAKSLAN